ncbi:MAG: hypothetical protein ABSF38_08390 [Verrucomicrobiota bacterium]|jgi:hypothetical protein
MELTSETMSNDGMDQTNAGLKKGKRKKRPGALKGVRAGLRMQMSKRRARAFVRSIGAA